MIKAISILEEGPGKNATRAPLWFSALIIGMIIATAPAVLFARDRGVNQPGVAGGVEGVEPHRDRGFNQPGAAGNVEPGRDPGVNQPGAAGNVEPGRDPGVNQPGAAGNVEPRRDPGVNQPGALGNRRGFHR